MKIYIVIGSCGQHDDYCEWMVAAYTKIEQAEKHSYKAHTWATKSYREYAKNNDKYSWDVKQGECPWDPHMHTDYNGTDYRVRSIELFDSLEEFGMFVAFGHYEEQKTVFTPTES